MDEGCREVQQSGDGTMSPVGRAERNADVSKEDGNSQVLTCDELSLGMEVCTCENPGMGLECDEDILTTSSLEHPSGGSVVEERVTTNEDQSTIARTGSEKQPQCPDYERLSLPGHSRLCEPYSDSSALDDTSQTSQTDETYIASQLSSSQVDDVGEPLFSSPDDEEATVAANDREEGVLAAKGGVTNVGEASKTHLELGGGNLSEVGIAEQRGRMRRKKRRVRNWSKVAVQRSRSRPKPERLRAVQCPAGESSDSSETTADEECSNRAIRRTSGKRSSLLLPSQTPVPPLKKQKFSHEPPRNILGAILTDIPEIDIRPQALPKLSKQSREEEQSIREKCEGGGGEKCEGGGGEKCEGGGGEKCEGGGGEKCEGGGGEQCEGGGGEKCECGGKERLVKETGEGCEHSGGGKLVKGRTVKRGEQEKGKQPWKTPKQDKRPDCRTSNHHHILMSWERDYPLGLRATRAPVLYAMTNIPDQVRAVKGGWINRAKLMWATWKKISVAKRDEYCEKAKLNRLREKEIEKTSTSVGEHRTKPAPPTRAKRPKNGSSSSKRSSGLTTSGAGRGASRTAVQQRERDKNGVCNGSPATSTSSTVPKKSESGLVSLHPPTSGVATPIFVSVNLPFPSKTAPSLSSSPGLYFYGSPVALSSPMLLSSPLVNGGPFGLSSPLMSPFVNLATTDHAHTLPRFLSECHTPLMTTSSCDPPTSIRSAPLSVKETISQKMTRSASIPCSKQKQEAARNEITSLPMIPDAVGSISIAASGAQCSTHSVAPVYTSCREKMCFGSTTSTVTTVCTSTLTQSFPSRHPLFLPLNPSTSVPTSCLTPPTYVASHTYLSATLPLLPSVTPSVRPGPPTTANISSVSHPAHLHATSEGSSRKRVHSESSAHASWKGLPPPRSRSHSTGTERMTSLSSKRSAWGHTSDSAAQSISCVTSPTCHPSSSYLSNPKSRTLSPELLKYLTLSSLSTTTPNHPLPSLLSPTHSLSSTTFPSETTSLATSATITPTHQQSSVSFQTSIGVRPSPAFYHSSFSCTASSLQSGTCRPTISTSEPLGIRSTYAVASSSSGHTSNTYMPTGMCSTFSSDSLLPPFIRASSCPFDSFCTENKVLDSKRDHLDSYLDSVVKADAEKFTVDRPRLLSKLTQTSNSSGLNIYRQRNVELPARYANRHAAKTKGSKRVVGHEKKKRRGGSGDGSSRGRSGSRRSTEGKGGVSPMTESAGKGHPMPNATLPSLTVSDNQMTGVNSSVRALVNMSNPMTLKSDGNSASLVSLKSSSAFTYPRTSIVTSRTPPWLTYNSNHSTFTTSLINCTVPNGLHVHSTKNGDDKVTSNKESCANHFPPIKRRLSTLSSPTLRLPLLSSSLSSHPHRSLLLQPNSPLTRSASQSTEGEETFGPGSVIPYGLDTLIPRLPNDLLLNGGSANSRGSSVVTQGQNEPGTSRPSYSDVTSSGGHSSRVPLMPPSGIVYSTPHLSSSTYYTSLSQPLSSYTPLSAVSPISTAARIGRRTSAATRLVTSCGNTAQLRADMKEEEGYGRIPLSSAQQQSLSALLSFSQSSLSAKAMTSSSQWIPSFNSGVQATPNSSSTMSSTGKTTLERKTGKSPVDKIIMKSPTGTCKTRRRRKNSCSEVRKRTNPLSMAGTTLTSAGQLSNGILGHSTLPHPFTMLPLSPSTPLTPFPQACIPIPRLSMPSTPLTPPLTTHTAISHTPIPPAPVPRTPLTPITPHTVIPHTPILHAPIPHTCSSLPSTPLTPLGPPGKFQTVHQPIEHPNMKPGQAATLLGHPTLSSGQLTPHLPPQQFISNLAYWELECLYYQSLVVLEQQARYTKLLAAEIQRRKETGCQQTDAGNSKQMSNNERLQTYQHFLSYISEPEFETSVPTETQGCGNPADVIFQETSRAQDTPRLLPELDYYADFLKQCSAKVVTTDSAPPSLS